MKLWLLVLFFDHVAIIAEAHVPMAECIDLANTTKLEMQQQATDAPPSQRMYLDRLVEPADIDAICILADEPPKLRTLIPLT